MAENIEKKKLREKDFPQEQIFIHILSTTNFLTPNRSEIDFPPPFMSEIDPISFPTFLPPPWIQSGDYNWLRWLQSIMS